MNGEVIAGRRKRGSSRRSRRYEDETSAAEVRSFSADFRSAEMRMDNQGSDPNQVRCCGDGLKFGYMNEPIHATIDTRNAGPGELVVNCTHSSESGRPAYCQLRDHADGTFTLTVRAQDDGDHRLNVWYDAVDVPGSPFYLRVSPASLVRVRGLRDWVIGTEGCGEFLIDTSMTGSGDVKVRVGGPRNGFRLETKRNGESLWCRFQPRIGGLYVVSVEWNDDLIPTFPHQLRLFDSYDQYRDYKDYVHSDNSSVSPPR